MSDTPDIAPGNQHLIPTLRFDDYDSSIGNRNDALIVDNHIRRVLSADTTVTAARDSLWSYPSREAKLAAFDRWLMIHLESCNGRPSPLLP